MLSDTGIKTEKWACLRNSQHFSQAPINNVKDNMFHEVRSESFMVSTMLFKRNIIPKLWGKFYFIQRCVTHDFNTDSIQSQSIPRHVTSIITIIYNYAFARNLLVAVDLATAWISHPSPLLDGTVGGSQTQVTWSVSAPYVGTIPYTFQTPTYCSQHPSLSIYSALPLPTITSLTATVCWLLSQLYLSFWPYNPTISAHIYIASHISQPGWMIELFLIATTSCDVKVH